MTQQGQFDDWQTQAQNLTQQIIPEQANTKIEEQPQQQQIGNKQKNKPVDVKQIFLDKIKKYKDINQNNYQEYYEEVKNNSTNKEIKISNQILKNDKDFINFGKLVAKRFIDHATDKQIDTLDQNDLLSFVDQAIFLLYNQLQSKNIHSVKDKLLIAKGERKKTEKQDKKKQQIQERRKRQQKSLQEANQNIKKQQKKVQDDIFGGAALITSKQLQDQLKSKDTKVVETSKKQEQDDDDFM